MDAGGPVTTARISQIDAMPPGLARSHAAEEAVARVEAEGPEAILAYALNTLVTSYVLDDERVKAFAPFTRAVRLWDAHPDLFDDHDRSQLFWSFKWMIAGLVSIPTVPAQQIEATLRDMAERYAVAGNGMNAVRLQEYLWARARGTDDVDERFRAWVTTPRDEYSHCEACEPHIIALHRAGNGQLDDAIDLLERTVASGASCGDEPADMLGSLALLLLDAGRPADAARAYRAAHHRLADVVGDPASPHGHLLVVLARTGNHDQALRRLVSDRRFLVAADTPAAHLDQLRAVLTATRLLERAGLGAHPLALEVVPATTVSELREHAEQVARDLAGAFDTRNGSSRETDRLGHEAARLPSVLAVDLGVLDPTMHLAPGLAGDAPSLGGPGLSGGSGAEVAGSTTPAPEADSHGDDPQAAWTRAEACSRAGYHEGAAGLYAAAARAAEAAGYPAEAGLALAEAARCAQVLGDDAGAGAAYTRALALQHAGDGDLGVRAQVAAAALTCLPALSADSAHQLRAELGRLHAVATTAADPDGPGTATQHRTLASIRSTLADVALARGETAAALDLALDAVSLAAGSPEVARPHRIAARALVDLGLRDDARTQLLSARTALRGRRHTAALAEIDSELLALAQDEPDTAD